MSDISSTVTTFGNVHVSSANGETKVKNSA